MEAVPFFTGKPRSFPFHFAASKENKKKRPPPLPPPLWREQELKPPSSSSVRLSLKGTCRASPRALASSPRPRALCARGSCPSPVAPCPGLLVIYFVFSSVQNRHGQLLVSSGRLRISPPCEVGRSLKEHVMSWGARVMSVLSHLKTKRCSSRAPSPCGFVTFILTWGRPPGRRGPRVKCRGSWRAVCGAFESGAPPEEGGAGARPVGRAPVGRCAFPREGGGDAAPGREGSLAGERGAAGAGSDRCPAEGGAGPAGGRSALAPFRCRFLRGTQYWASEELVWAFSPLGLTCCLLEIRRGICSLLWHTSTAGLQVELE